MKNPLVAAVRELNRLERDLKRADEPTEQLIRLEAMARLLLGDGPVGWATMAVVAAAEVDERLIERDAVRFCTAQLERRLIAVSQELYRLRKLVRDETVLREPVSSWRGGGASDVGRVIADLGRSEDVWTELALADLRKLAKHVLPALCRCLNAAEHDLPSGDDGARTRVCDFRERAVAVQVDANLAYEKIASVVALASAANHRNTHADLCRIERAIGGLRASKVDVDALADAEASLELLLPRCERLVSAVRARLLEGPERSHALNRLTTYLERFEGARLREKMSKAPSAERVLQETVDRFLFVAEGLYPITHMVAGRGLLDTLVETETKGMPSVLIELKQVVKGATEGKVRKAVKEGLVQVEHYSKHLRSHSRWAAHEVFCVVVYAGSTRFSVIDDPRVRLIYLGETTPSGGARRAGKTSAGLKRGRARMLLK